ncbi:MAG: di-heme oxidoredictase family protein [Myxococcota bacterium]
MKTARSLYVLFTGALCAGSSSCSGDAHSIDEADLLPERAYSGGDTTVFNTTPNAFGFSARNLASEKKSAFFVGNSFFNQNWVTAPASTTARDGLGPVFNGLSCSSCHFKDGRGAPYEEDGSIGISLLFRLSVPDGDGGWVSDPVYGPQLNPRGILGVDGEATPTVTFEEVPGAYEDGTPYTLVRPVFTLEDPGYGEFGEGLVISPRLAPVVFGLGLLEAIPEERLLELADPKDEDGDGISGRPNRVFDIERGEVVVGRFGLKANEPSLIQQNAGAFRGDIGITSEFFPEESCTDAQMECLEAPTGNDDQGIEIDRHRLERVTFYTSTLAVPGQRDANDPEVLRGVELFEQVGCEGCHVSRHVTGAVAGLEELSDQVVYPYTDLLLHDMGPDLADGRPDGEATGSEWRTPPLWGLGLQKAVNRHTFFLHDGRARSMEEAILWHGGEALASRDAFRALDAGDRRALLTFLNSL